MDFLERQMELCQLASFINEQERWLESVLDRLQWTRENLSSERASSEQCSYNTNHFIPSSSLKAHEVTCWYSKHGVKLDSEEAQTLMSGSDIYANSNIPHLHIDHATERAVVKLAEQLEAERSHPQASSSGSTSRLDVMATSKYDTSIEDTRVTPPKLLSQQAHQIISYIKSWKKIPRDFFTLTISSHNLAQVKGWLFQHLPDKHIHSSTLGGEMVTVETIMKWLTPASQDALCPTPDTLVNKVKPVLGTKSKSFVLDLWKFVHISRLQSEHGIEDNFVEDIVPLTAAALLNLPEEGAEEEAPSISERVKELLLSTEAGGNDDTTDEPYLPLPMDQVFYKFTTNERKTLYDYAVEMTSSKLGSSSKLKDLDPDLYRDDAAALKAKLKAQSNLPVPDDGEEKIFRDIISNRMEEMTAAATEEAESKGQSIHEDSSLLEEASERGSRDNTERAERRERRSRSPYRERDRSFREDEGDHSEREKRRSHHYRSRSRSQSTSRSRSDRHKKHKKHRSRSRSRSKERSSSRHKKKHKHRHHHSRSKSPAKDID